MSLTLCRGIQLEILPNIGHISSSIFARAVYLLKADHSEGLFDRNAYPRISVREADMYNYDFKDKWEGKKEAGGMPKK